MAALPNQEFPGVPPPPRGADFVLRNARVRFIFAVFFSFSVRHSKVLPPKVKLSMKLGT